jgi:hypothetical protein
MTTGLTYTTYLSEIARLAVVDPADANFLESLPMAITDAENRMCREFDFLTFVQSNTTFSVSANSRYVNVPLGTFVTIQNVNVVTPVGQTNPDLAGNKRNPLVPVSKEFLDFVYGSNAVTSMPIFFAMMNENSFIVGPWADQTYGLELVGTVRPASLSVANPSTFISTYLPDLFVAASMVYIAGYQRDFGRQSDDPQLAVSWEAHYQTLKAGADVEEARKKFNAGAWSSMSPATVATPTRG